MTVPPVFIYAEAFLFWIIFVWSFSLEIIHSGIIRGDPQNKQDSGTLQLININQ
jgi:hypothetical protein